MTTLLAVLLVYALALVAIGAWIGRRVGTTQSFFVSNRMMGPGMLAATLLAANVGSAATVGATSLAYQFGVAAWWWTGSAGIGSLALALFVGPRLWRVAKAHNLLTVGDFLEFHYGAGVRNVAALVIWLAGFLVLTGQLKGAGEVLSAAGHLSLMQGCTLAAIVMAAYFSTGGLRSAAPVNVVQLAIKLIGFGIAAPMALAAVGGLEHAYAIHPSGSHFFQSANPNAGWTALFLLAPAFLFSPGILQKVYGARSERAVRLGVGINAIGLLLFAALPVLCGFAARAMFPELERNEQALPRLMAEGLPTWLSALALAAVFSAEMSAGDAVLFMLSTSGARDLYRGVLNPGATDRQLLTVARVLAVVAAVVGLALTYYIETVVQALSLFYSMLGAALSGPILGALIRPASSRAALSSMIVGITATIAAYAVLAGGVARGWMSPAFFGLAANLLTYWFVGLFDARTQTPPRR